MSNTKQMAWHEYRDAFQAIRMGAREIAGRLHCTIGHVDAVLCGAVPVSQRFAENMARLLRQYQRNELPEWVDKPDEQEDEAPKFYCGVGVYSAEFVPLPTQEATQVFAGSSEKLDVLRRRAARGEELFHADDLRISIHPTLRS